MIVNTVRMQRHTSRLRLVMLVLCMCPMPALASTCYGSVGHGRLEGGVQLPARGANFLAYSQLGVEMGRTYLHQAVHRVVLEAYAELYTTAPGQTFVYGETGLANGGPMRPHRTHQNGLSVDFMVPVVGAAGRPVLLPSSPANQFGYGVEFDAQGRAAALRIDFEAMAEHLYQLQRAAQRHQVRITRVIFDPPLMKHLLDGTRRGDALRRSLPFMQGKPWIRHDEHYHVDFGVGCKPMTERMP